MTAEHMLDWSPTSAKSTNIDQTLPTGRSSAASKSTPHASQPEPHTLVFHRRAGSQASCRGCALILCTMPDLGKVQIPKFRNRPAWICNDCSFSLCPTCHSSGLFNHDKDARKSSKTKALWVSLPATLPPAFKSWKLYLEYAIKSHVYA